MSKLEIKILTRDYSKGRGVFDLSFSVSQGEVFRHWRSSYR
ncbi:hypothetical protein [Desulfitobacterium hafniense]|nr:hypothetical protein [Desulfitobacterium hafniense]